MSYLVATFYQFVALSDYRQKQPEIQKYCQERGIKGTILLAAEGINATIAGNSQAIAEVISWLKTDTRLANLEVKESVCDYLPFQRLKIRLKQEIVTFGQPKANPLENTGIHLKTEEWNQLLKEPDVVVIDTRNNYEVAIGTFAGALNPEIAHVGMDETQAQTRGLVTNTIKIPLSIVDRAIADGELPLDQLISGEYDKVRENLGRGNPPKRPQYLQKPGTGDN